MEVNNNINSQTKIKNNVFDDNVEEAMRLSSSSDIEVESNYIINTKKIVMYLFQTYDSNIHNNEFNCMNFDGIDLKNSWLNNLTENKFLNSKKCKIHLEDCERNEIDMKCNTGAACVNHGTNCSCCN